MSRTRKTPNGKIQNDKQTIETHIPSHLTVGLEDAVLTSDWINLFEATLLWLSSILRIYYVTSEEDVIQLYIVDFVLLDHCRLFSLDEMKNI